MNFLKLLNRSLSLALFLCFFLVSAQNTEISKEEMVLAGGCFTLDGFVQTGEMDTPFYFKASGLGEYILYSKNQKYLSLDSKYRLILSGERSSEIIWKIEQEKDGKITLFHNNKGLFLGENNTLTRVKPSAKRFGLQPSIQCVPFPEADLDAKINHPLKTQNPDGTLYGLADVHNHMGAFTMANSRINAGKPFSPLGIEDALGSCQAVHGKHGIFDIGGNQIRMSGQDISKLNPLDILSGHNTKGYPSFEEYPAFDMPTHQMSYYKWLERARLGGLRLLVAYVEDSWATNTIGNFVYPLTRFDRKVENQKTDPSTYNMEKRTVEYLQFYRDLESYIDAQEGGKGKGWLRIVTSPKEAREEISKGNLALVLGMEMPTPMACADIPGRAECTEEYIREKLFEYKKLGVSVMFPVHHIDNDFSDGHHIGAAFELMQFLGSGKKIDWDECENGITPALTQNKVNNLKGIRKKIVTRYLEKNQKELPLIDPSKKYCQKNPLPEKGRILAVEMMKMGMLIDLDHNAEGARKELEELLKQEGYPALYTHSKHLLDSDNEIRTQEDGFMTTTLQTKAPTEKNACKYATTEDLMFYTQTTAQLTEKYQNFPAKMISTDFFGTLIGTGPRFNPTTNPCKTKQANPMSYPFTSFGGDVVFDKLSTGEKTWDFNGDGLANIGLLPDLIADIQAQGYTPEEIQPLFNGAEMYIRIWEQAQEVSLRLQQEKGLKYLK
ncbi:MAG: hypothetical protein C4K58_01160 [Flavobacteriaceae bacterium]|nr:MAG: hypothetical protein C4K58_01160 [Flavobacteriaceae bacterium]